jgi:hypothetical protein
MERCDIYHQSFLDNHSLRNREDNDLAVENSIKDTLAISLKSIKYASLLKKINISMSLKTSFKILCMTLMKERRLLPSKFHCAFFFAYKPPEFGIVASLINGCINLFQYSLGDLSNKSPPKFTNEGIRKKGNFSTKQRACHNS